MCHLIFIYTVYFGLLAIARLPFPLFSCCCCWQGHPNAAEWYSLCALGVVGMEGTAKGLRGIEVLVGLPYPASIKRALC